MLSIARLFADDSSLSSTSSDISDLEGIINHDLQVISLWAKQWLVSFNPSKTEAMLFSTRPIEHNLKLMFDNTQVTFVDDHKHLGLTFSSNGKWHSHLNKIISSASSLLGLMKKMKFQLSRTSLNQIYISFIRPVLEYASVVWDGCTEYEKDSLEKMQYEAARIVTGLTRSVSLYKLKHEIGWQYLIS